VPKVSERQRAAKGADQLQAALLTAKQMAIRDQAPRGIRIQPVPIIFSAAQAVPAGSVVINVATLTPLETGVVFTPGSSPLGGTTPEGLRWTIQGGSLLVAYDRDPVDPELFANVEVIQVTATTATTFAAGFSRPHAGGFALKILAYARELQFIEQPDDF